MSNLIPTIGLVLRAIRVQLITLAILGTLYLGTSMGLVPPPSELNHRLLELFRSYGLVVVGFAAIVENLAGVAVYFPGSIVILTAMALTSGNPHKAFLVWVTIVACSFLSHHVNYVAGRMLSRSGDRIGTQKITPSRLWKKLVTCLTTFWHPHLASVTSLAFGAERVPYNHFIVSIGVAGLLWYGFWGITLYHAGLSGMLQGNLVPLFLVYLTLWSMWDIVGLWRSRHK